MGYQSILLTPDTTIRTIYETQTGARVDWLSCRYVTRSQPVATSAATNYDTPPHLGYGSAANIPDEARNSPHLILYFRFQGSWIEWGRAPLRASGRADWGLLDLKRYFSDSDLSLGPGAAIGCNLSYDSASDDCVVIGGVSFDDPVSPASGGDTPPGTILWFGGVTAPTGFLTLNGDGIARSSFPLLDSAVWCGASLNATAQSFYRFTNLASPATSRSETGSFLKLPDLRGEFIRGLDLGRGVDSGRAIGSAQAATGIGILIETSNRVQFVDQEGSVSGGNMSYSGPLNNLIAAQSFSRVRSRNIALLPIIKV